MILADALSISINLMLVAHVVISLLLILVVLMQRPKQEGLGAAFGGGMTDQMFGAQTTNVLQKGTVYLGTLFVVLSLVLAILIGNQNDQKAIVAPDSGTVEEAPAVPDTVPGGGSIKEELEKEEGAVTPTGDEATAPTGDEAAAPTGDEAAAPTGDEAAAPTGDEAAAPTGDEVAAPTGDEAAAPTGDEAAAPTGDEAPAPTGDEAAAPTGGEAPAPVEGGSEDKPE